MNKPVNLVFDLVDKCNLSCKSCYRGIIGNEKTVMANKTIEIVLEHAMKYFSISRIWPYNWSEPFLAPHLPDFIDVCRNYPEVTLDISSNFNVTMDREILKNILPRIDVLKISASGLEQKIYEKYHTNGNIDTVLSNINLVMDIKKEMNLNTQLVWVFGENLYNSSQKDIISDYCNTNNIYLMSIPYYLTDAKSIYQVYKNQPIAKSEYDILYSSYEDLREQITNKMQPDFCCIIDRDIVVDYRGNLMTCCGTDIKLNVPFTEMKNMEQIREIKLSNEFCKKCYKLGLSGLYL